MAAREVPEFPGQPEPPGTRPAPPGEADGETAVRRLAAASATARSVFPAGSLNARTAAAMRPQGR